MLWLATFGLLTALGRLALGEVIAAGLGGFSALADLVNAQFRHPFAEYWGDGTTSSSDGQNLRTGSKAESTGHIDLKYGSSPGRTFYTHISDQYAPFYTKVVNVGVRDSTYVLDGLLYHESDLHIEEHYTDTAQSPHS